MKYHKKPVAVEAFQWFCCDGATGPVRSLGNDAQNEEYFGLVTATGQVIVSAGDWIITGVKGEHYPCKPDIFEQTYEKVED